MAAKSTDLRRYWIIILHIFLTAFLFAQSEDIKFEHLTIKDGLSNNPVSSIIQDSKGFMWFGGNGLSKYDGYKFTNYRNDPDDSTSLADNFITALYEDHSGELWIGTQSGGLCRYDRDQDAFIRYKTEKGNPNSLLKNQVVDIYETDQNVLWIGCAGAINKYDRETDNFSRYYPEGMDSTFKTNINFIGAITQDETGRLWIGTWNRGLFYFDAEKDKFIKYKPRPEYAKTFVNQFATRILATRLNGRDYLWFVGFQNGLYRIDLDNDEIKHYQHQPDNPASLSDDNIIDIYQAANENRQLWIGTQGGLNRFDIQAEAFTHCRHRPGDQSSLLHDFVGSIFKDKSGLIWVATWKGINKFQPKPSNFQAIGQDDENPEGLAGKVVTAIHGSTVKGDKSMLWVGTSDGLYMLDRTNGLFTAFKHDPQDKNSLSHNWVTEIIEAHLENKKVLWVSTTNGLNKIDLKTREITRYYAPSNDPDHNEIWSICEDKNGIIWLGTQSRYLYSFNPETEQFTRYGPFGNIYTLQMDKSGMLWIGMGNGLYEFNPVTKKVKRYRQIENDFKSLSYSGVMSIMQDKNGTLWIATSVGLYKFDHSTERFVRFGEKDGLISGDVRAILEDRHGNLWLSTNKGISRFNPNSKSIRNYDVSDGLHGNEFARHACYLNQRGEMFFGGVDGLTYFHPDSIKDNIYVPPIVLTDFRIFNKSIKPGQNSLLKKQVSEVSEITLSHDQSILSFEFAALEYHHPEKIKYAYKMEKVDPDWVSTDASRRFVTYTQLNPGEYVFRVKGSNSDGIWNEQETSVRITILPPWWKTWWAYSIYIALILGTLYILRRYELSRQRFKHQMELKNVEAKKFQELDRMKSRFFANISHEFRTPLTLILGPVKQMLSGESKGNPKEQYKMILRYGHRLLNLINQILDLSKLESGRMTLEVRYTDIKQFLTGIVQSFASLAERKKITLRFKTEVESMLGVVDQDKLVKIVTNLLSNAFKFTPEGGEVNVDLSARGDMAQRQSPSLEEDELAMSASRQTRNNSISPTFLQISIFNSGSAISSNQLSKIFDRFYQADESYAKDSEGTGIGLALTKELVEAHHGEIRAESELNKGTTFTVWLPIQKEHFKPEEIVDMPISLLHGVLDPSKGETEFSLLEGDASRAGDVLAATRPRTSKFAPLLLIVEDNPDVTTYINSSLEQNYRTITAENGEEGLKKALKKFPDLIISDVMMPVMDGFQFCRKLKSDQRISHIPLILLTAKADMESKLEGLEFGADDYVTKPFDAKELSLRSKNLLEQRQRLREHFEQRVDFKPADITVNSMDEQFMQKVIELIERHIDNPDFGAEKFSQEVGMSYQHLNRKLHALTNHSAMDFIRTMRLKRAAQLLQRKSDIVTQIAYQVGFNNPSYFAECFKKQFGVSPSEYSARST